MVRRHGIALGQLLLRNPDLLLLDEPTNHLDVDSIEMARIISRTIIEQ